MRYSYEFKRKCVEMYRQGIVPDIPKGISRERFIHYLNDWMHLEDAQGPDALKPKGSYKKWSPEEKLELVARVISGESNKSVAIHAGIRDSMLYQWVRKYKI